MAALIVAFLVSSTVTLLVLRYEHLHSHLSADDDLNGVQKFHVAPVPRVGGVGVLIGLFFGVVTQRVADASLSNLGHLLIAASLPAFFAGLVEDLTKRVSVSKRLLATALSAALAGWMLEAWISRLAVPWLDVLLAFGFISIFFTCFAVAGVANAFNLIDGYNGLAGMVAVIILFGLAYVAKQVGDREIMITSLVVAGAILGFLVWNYPRGLIFLGDGGAYLVGFLVAELSLLLVVKNPQVSPWFPLLLIFYPIFETLFSIFRRVIIGRRHPGLPDAAHLHQLIYRFVVRWAIGDQAPKRKIERNALTSPYLWVMASFAVVPSLFFWDNTPMLQLFIFLFAILYVFTYRQVFKGKFPRWLSIRKKNQGR